VLVAFVGIIYNDFSAIMDNGFFQGYSYITWFVIISQVLVVINQFIFNFLQKKLFSKSSKFFVRLRLIFANSKSFFLDYLF